MKKVLLIVFICAVFLREFKSKPTQRIVAGKMVSIKDFPYQLAVVAKIPYGERNETTYELLLGGGVIITQLWALSAAHLFKNRTDWTYHLRGNSSLWEQPRCKSCIDHKIIIIQKHPLYNPDTNDYNIALLKARPAFRGRYETPVYVAGSDYYYPTYSEGIITGWGKVRVGQLATKQARLRAAYVDIINHQECFENYSNRSDFSARMLCAGDSGSNYCYGDDGGPLVKNGVLIGIALNHRACGEKDLPGLYTNLSSIYRWFPLYATKHRIPLHIKFVD